MLDYIFIKYILRDINKAFFINWTKIFNYMTIDIHDIVYNYDVWYLFIV